MRRHGTTLLEVSVSAALAAVLAAIAVQAVVALSHQQQAAGRRALAMQAADNVMERFTARDWSEINPDAGREIAVPPWAAETLPDARLKVHVANEAGPPEARRITVVLDWAHRGARPAPVRLVSWVFQPKTGEP